jgi:hypothetical protein
MLSKSKSFHPVFNKLGEYVGGHNISTKFYNQPNPPGTPELWPLNCPKLLFPLSKSKSFHPVFIKLGEYVVCPKTELAVSALQVELFSSLRNFDDQHFDGRILCQFGTLVINDKATAKGVNP